MTHDERQKEIVKTINNLALIHTELSRFVKGEYYSSIHNHRRQITVLDATIKILELY